jgi:hypothetical protein
MSYGSTRLPPLRFGGYLEVASFLVALRGALREIAKTGEGQKDLFEPMRQAAVRAAAHVAIDPSRQG